MKKTEFTTRNLPDWHPLARLRHHVTGAIDRGTAEPIIEIPAAALTEKERPHTPGHTFWDSCSTEPA